MANPNKKNPFMGSMGGFTIDDPIPQFSPSTTPPSAPPSTPPSGPPPGPTPPPPSSGGGGGGGGGGGSGGSWWTGGHIGTVGGLGWYQSVRPQQPVPRGFSTANPHAYTREVQPGELVENRITNLLSTDNPYIQNARQRGVEYAARRGGVNTSIAAGASERAAIESALPIASQDAETMRRTASENLGFLNQGLFLERELQNRLAVASVGAAASMYAADVQREIAFRGFEEDLRRQRERLAFEGEQRGLDRAHDMMMTNLNYSWRDLIATNDTLRQDWLESNRFEREFLGGIVSMGVRSAAEFTSLIGQAALENPDLIDPVIAQNFGTVLGSVYNRILGGVLSFMSNIRGPGGG